MSRKTKKRTEEPKPGVPGWVVSFGDMITNLLACFVLLLSLSERNKSLFKTGMSSYRRAISNFGLPDWFFGEEPNPNDRDLRKIKYPTESSAKQDDQKRIIDQEADIIRSLFKQISQQLQTRSNDNVEIIETVIPIPKLFPAGNSELTKASIGKLTHVLSVLNPLPSNAKRTIRIIGIGGDLPTEKQKWMVAADRASVVEQYVRKFFTQKKLMEKWDIVSEGIGDTDSISRFHDLPPTDISIIIIISKVSSGNGQG